MGEKIEYIKEIYLLQKHLMLPSNEIMLMSEYERKNLVKTLKEQINNEKK